MEGRDPAVAGENLKSEHITEEVRARVENCYITGGHQAPALHLPERGPKGLYPA